MKYTRTKNRQEIKKQEIKNLKTFCISENDNATAKENQFHFYLMAYVQLHISKFIALKK